jgi:hypothetical protein
MLASFVVAIDGHGRYVGDGQFEPTWIRQFYQQYIYPKLQPNQRVWVVPGLTGPLQDGIAPPGPPYLNDTLFLEKIQVKTGIFRNVPRPSYDCLSANALATGLLRLGAAR